MSQKPSEVPEYLWDWALQVYEPEGAAIWFNAPNTLLNSRSPIQCLRDGEGYRVNTLLDMLTTGAFG